MTYPSWLPPCPPDPERWRSWIVDDRWQVSDLGRVRTATGRPVEVWKNCRGYAHVWLEGYSPKPIAVHLMVKRTFSINPLPLTHPMVDHINRDRMDCRLSNLRWSNIELNSGNKKSRGYTIRKYKTRKGVTIKYRPAIRVNQKLVHLGSYASAKEARAVYLEAVERRHEVL